MTKKFTCSILSHLAGCQAATGLAVDGHGHAQACPGQLKFNCAAVFGQMTMLALCHSDCSVEGSFGVMAAERPARQLVGVEASAAC